MVFISILRLKVADDLQEKNYTWKKLRDVYVLMSSFYAVSDIASRRKAACFILCTTKICRIIDVAGIPHATPKAFIIISISCTQSFVKTRAHLNIFYWVEFVKGSIFFVKIWFFSLKTMTMHVFTKANRVISKTLIIIIAHIHSILICN